MACVVAAALLSGLIHALGALLTIPKVGKFLFERKWLPSEENAIDVPSTRMLHRALLVVCTAVFLAFVWVNCRHV
jgi:hypothetical protein